MSATSTSDDPVDTIVDLLDGTSAANWPNGTKPTYIETRRTSSRDQKRRREDPAVYVHSPEVGPQEQFGRNATTKIQTAVVDAEVWSRDDSQAQTLASDVTAILEDFWNDAKANTNWNRIRPQSDSDQRDEESPETIMGRDDNQYQIAVRIELQREASMGT